MPAWRRDGRELVYRNGNRLMSVPVDTSAAAPFHRPMELLALPPGTDYVAMAPDGTRFFAVYRDGQEVVARELDITLDWLSDLKARVPRP